VQGFTVEETNPFLGLRGIRLSLARPKIFRVQITLTLLDDETLRLWDAPVHSAALRWGM
jgi:signal transduction protein with GAF and PtsI domain